ncbi:MAG: hypothetical protein WAM94_12720, partial [Chromatiaceae bacterium]
RHLFEQIIRENIDLGRPSKVSLIFNRRLNKRTPGTFHTRVVTQGVIPALHVSYKFSKIKQYFKEGRALRTETTINNTHDFGVGRRLSNLPALRAIGFNANRRLLEVETLSQDCTLAEGLFDQVTQPQILNGQRAAGLRFDDARVMALLQVLCLFLGLPEGFRNASMRQWMAQALAVPVDAYSPGRMTYDLRRLRLHGLIERIPHSHRYQVTDLGIRVALFFTKVHSRILLPGLSQLFDGCPKATNRPVARAMRRLQQTLADLFHQAKLEPCKI